jgi:parallel beta-helix repeat protein
MHVESTRRVAALAIGVALIQASLAGARTIVVRTTIQAAVNQAVPGDIVHIPPGIYRENVQITTDHLTVRGSQKAILDGSGLTGSTGIRVAPASGAARLTGFTLEGLTIRNYRLTGVLVLRTDGYRLLGSRYEDNEEYGPFPIFSTNGLIASNDVSGSNDACIYVGRSEDAVIRDNVVTRCLTGIQIENSERIEVSRNIVTDSSLGIVTLIVPGAPVAAVRDVTLTDNLLARNNRPNDADDALLSMLPAGVGVLVLGGERVRVTGNIVLQHDTAGIAIGQVPPDVAILDPRMTPYPIGARVTANVALGNGGDPDPRIAPLPGVDLLWDLSGSDNCWAMNVATSVFPTPLPDCHP